MSFQSKFKGASALGFAGHRCSGDKERVSRQMFCGVGKLGEESPRMASLGQEGLWLADKLNEVERRDALDVVEQTLFCQCRSHLTVSSALGHRQSGS